MTETQAKVFAQDERIRIYNKQYKKPRYVKSWQSPIIGKPKAPSGNSHLLSPQGE